MLFLILNVNVCVPVFPEAIFTEMGEIGRFWSVIATKLGIPLLKLYLSGLLFVAEYGKLKAIALLQILFTVLSVMVGDGFWVTT